MTAIKIRNLGKYVGSPVRLDGASSSEGMVILLRILGFNPKPKVRNGILRTVMIPGWVLQDVTLDIEFGSVVCLAGSSGSGKSVFLKLLAGAISPSTGSIEFYGVVSSLLSIGDNIDSRLTALENIENYRRFKGGGADNLDSYANEVIAFAELEGFEKMPVRTYSTGMTMRLSIALSLQDNPSIILIDDVLGVGDIAFQQKCVERLRNLKEAGCTMILALSDETLVQQIATRVIGLSGGRVIADGTQGNYFVGQGNTSKAGIEWQIANYLPENEVIALSNVSVDVSQDLNKPCLYLSIDVEVKRAPMQLRPCIDVMKGKVVLFRNLYPQVENVENEGNFGFAVEIPTCLLSDGGNTVTISVIAVQEKMVYSLKAFDAITILVKQDAVENEQFASVPFLNIRLPWEIENVVSGEVCNQK